MHYGVELESESQGLLPELPPEYFNKEREPAPPENEYMHGV